MPAYDFASIDLDGIDPYDDATMREMYPDLYDEEDGEKRGRRVQLPDDFESEQDFLRHVIELFTADEAADDLNRKAAKEDLEFAAGKQWDDGVEQARANDEVPALTFNRLPAFIGQLLGNRRLNEAAIKVLPDEDGTKEIAKARQGIIRGIEKLSKAQIAYNTAYQNQTISGDGAFMLQLEYAQADVFDQEIRIRQIPNALSVLFDRMSIDPTAADAGHCFVIDSMPEDEFKKTYPDAPVSAPSGAGDQFTAAVSAGGWFLENTVRVVEFWRMRTEPRTLAMLRNGKVADVTNVPIEQWAPYVMVGSDGEPILRDTERPYAEMYVLCGTAILAGPYHLPISRIPVFRAMGWEIYAGEQRIRFGTVRFLKDPQRMHNYWRSVIVEKLMKSPNSGWIASDQAVEGFEEDYRNAATTKDPLLRYNADAGTQPQQIPPVQLEGALIQEANMAVQDLRDISNMHEASLGMLGNEVSGRAISARQRVSELGSVIYTDNLNMAIEECGRAINELIPYIYDTPRTVRVIGEDEAEDLLRINDENGLPDISTGRYAVTITTGPSYSTKRAEAAESMLNMVNAMPQTLAVAADLIIEHQDWPGADKIAERLRAQSGVAGMDPEDMTPEQRQAAAAQAQLAQQVQQLEMRERMAEVAMKEAQAEDYRARAQQAQANALSAVAKLHLEGERLDLDRIKATLDALDLFSEIPKSMNVEEEG